MTFDNWATFHCKYYYYHLDYGHLTYSSVQCFPFIDLFVAPGTISKLTAPNRSSKRIILGWINCALHISKLKCCAGAFTLMYFWKEPTVSRKTLMSFSFRFSCNDWLSSVWAHYFDRSRYRGNHYISRYNSASCWQRMNLQVCGNTGVRLQTKSFRTVLRRCLSFDPCIIIIS